MDRLDSLLIEHRVPAEDPGTNALIQRLRAARRRGHLTQGELLDVVRWKSARALPLAATNSSGRVGRATRAALAARSERERLNRLTALRGVSIPMASAVLTLVDPGRYGVLDIRVWRLLHTLGVVEGNRRGVHFTFDQWSRFLDVIRHFAARHGMPARTIERTLFAIHARFHDGPLYERPGSSANEATSRTR
jgi:hypothetical protein